MRNIFIVPVMQHGCRAKPLQAKVLFFYLSARWINQSRIEKYISGNVIVQTHFVCYSEFHASREAIIRQLPMITDIRKGYASHTKQLRISNLIRYFCKNKSLRNTIASLFVTVERFFSIYRFVYPTYNGPFPSCCLSRFRSESSCSTIVREMSLISI